MYAVCACVHVCLVTSVVSDSATPRTAAHQAPLAMGFSRQEHWRGLPCPPPGDLPNPGIELTSLMSPTLAGRFFTTSATWEAPKAEEPESDGYFPSLSLFPGG